MRPRGREAGGACGTGKGTGTGPVVGTAASGPGTGITIDTDIYNDLTVTYDLSLVAKDKTGDYASASGSQSSVELGWGGGSHGTSTHSLDLASNFATNAKGDLDTTLTQDEFDIDVNSGGGDHIKETIPQASSIERIAAYLCGGDDHYNGGSDGGSDGESDAAISQFVFGGAGDDHIKGGRGNDVLSGGSGNDDLQGGSGLDILIGGFGEDKLEGGRADDLLVGGSAENENDLASLEAAMADWATNGLAADLLDLGAVTDDGKKDELHGEKGTDKLIGGVGDKLKQ